MYRWIEHTGELELSIEAPTEAGVFEDALAALADLLGERLETAGGGRRAGRMVQEVAVSAPDRAALLVEWLGELVFLSETEDLVPERLVQLDLADGRLTATVEGRSGHASHLVKGATYHRLAFDRKDDGWQANVVLDV